MQHEIDDQIIALTKNREICVTVASSCAAMRERQKKYLKSVEGRKELDQLILSHQLPEFRELEAEPAAPPLEVSSRFNPVHN